MMTERCCSHHMTGDAQFNEVVNSKVTLILQRNTFISFTKTYRATAITIKHVMNDGHYIPADLQWEK